MLIKEIVEATTPRDMMEAVSAFHTEYSADALLSVAGFYEDPDLKLSVVPTVLQKTSVESTNYLLAKAAADSDIQKRIMPKVQDTCRKIMAP